jgi:hypothetical protein
MDVAKLISKLMAHIANDEWADLVKLQAKAEKSNPSPS